MSKPSNVALTQHQQELVSLVKAAHQTLGVARRMRVSETTRRLEAARAEIKREAERKLEEAEEIIKAEMAADIVRHESALDEALIAAYNAGVPVRQIALQGFSSRYDGAVHEFIRALRADGRVGTRVNYQRNSSTEPRPAEIVFPDPVDVDSVLAEVNAIDEPAFDRLDDLIELVPADASGQNGISVPGVLLTLDPRDPWFAKIAGNARKGTPYSKATFCTLYEHPATKEIVAVESRETGGVTWDHPVARWAKEHPQETRAGFEAALYADASSAE